MIALLAGSLFATSHVQDLIPWQRNLVNAKSGARRSNMLIFAEFVDNQDTSLAESDAMTFTGSSVQKVMANFIAVKVERSADTLAFKQYSVDATPVAYMIDAQGAARGHFMLPQDPDALTYQLKRWIEVDKGFESATTRALQSTVPRETLTVAAMGYAYRFKFPEANAIMERLAERGAPAEAMLVLGQAYALRGGAKTALFWFNRGLKGATNSAQRSWARRGIAESALALGDSERAKAMWQKIVDDSSATPVDQWAARLGLSRLGKKAQSYREALTQS